MNDTNGGTPDLRSLTERLLPYIEGYHKLNMQNPYSFPSFVATLESEINSVIHAIERGDITAECDKETLEKFIEIAQKQYLPALPVDHSETGLQTGKGIFFQIVPENLLNKLLTLVGIQKKG